MLLLQTDVLDAGDFTEATRATYQKALTFYDPWHAAERPSLPWFDNGLVAIPVSLPDDEILLDRLPPTGTITLVANASCGAAMKNFARVYSCNLIGDFNAAGQRCQQACGNAQCAEQ